MKTKRDWALEKLRELKGVKSVEPIDHDYILIHRDADLSGEALPSFTACVIAVHRVTAEVLNPMLRNGQPVQFVANIPKDAVWEGSAIDLVGAVGIGWGGFGDLMSALRYSEVRVFQKREYLFVINNLLQHSRVVSIVRLFDRLLVVNRKTPLAPIQVVLLNEYELTADQIRHARATYGMFAAVLRTNPNGGATDNARAVAHEMGADIFQWGEFLSRLNRT